MLPVRGKEATCLCTHTLRTWLNVSLLWLLNNNNNSNNNLCKKCLGYKSKIWALSSSHVYSIKSQDLVPITAVLEHKGPLDKLILHSRRLMGLQCLLHVRWTHYQGTATGRTGTRPHLCYKDVLKPDWHRPGSQPSPEAKTKGLFVNVYIPHCNGTHAATCHRKKINVHIYNNQWKVRKMWQKRQRPSGLYQWRMQNPKFEVAMSHVTYVIAPFMQRLTPYRHLTLCMDTDFYYRSFNITWKKHKAFLWEKLNENFQLRPPGLITFRLNWLLETNLLFIQF